MNFKEKEKIRERVKLVQVLFIRGKVRIITTNVAEMEKRDGSRISSYESRVDDSITAVKWDQG